jgi:hypothetical protein
MRRLFTLFALVILAACGGAKSTAPSDASVPGTWTLTKYNGSAMPYTATVGDTKTELLSGSLVFTAPSSYALALSFRYTESGVSTNETQNSSGTYSVNGSTVTLQPQAGDPPSTGTIAGNTLSVNGDAFVFVKS